MRAVLLNQCVNPELNHLKLPYMNNTKNLILTFLILINRCSKLIAYMNLIKKVMLSNASTPSFGPYAQL